MNIAVCIGEKRDKHNIILGYYIQESLNGKRYIDKLTLKSLIKENKLSVTNLKLTSDNRLIKLDTNKTLENSKLNERLSKIEQKVVNDKKTEQIRKNKERAELTAVHEQIKALTPRIEALLTLANKCAEVGVKIPSEFVADSWLHCLGFTGISFGKTYSNKRFTHLAILAGGACGPWDFYSSGIETFVRNHETMQIKDVDSISKLRAFLTHFSVFEESFNKWVNSLA